MLVQFEELAVSQMCLYSFAKNTSQIDQKRSDMSATYSCLPVSSDTSEGA